jgi:hypothetical protein
METILEECNTEEQRSGVRFLFCGQNDSKQIIFIKKCFLFTVGNVTSICLVRRKKHLADKCFVDDEEVETEFRKWLRQQSKGFNAVGFDALIKRWDMCINVRGAYVEK